MKRLSIALMFVLAGGGGAAQSPFQDLTPGVSTKEDAARVLGAPVKSAGGPSEYKAPAAGMSRVDVQFSGNVIDRIDVQLDPPVTRRALLESYGFAAADARNVKDGKLIEFFGGEAWVAFTYAGDAEASGVATVSHYARRAFTAASGLKLPDAPVTAAPGTPGKVEKAGALIRGLAQIAGAIQGLRKGWTIHQQATLEGIIFSSYGAANGDRCQADCSANATCAAFVFVRAGHPNPGDPPMCHLMSSASRVIPAPCCAAGTRK